MPKQLSIRTKLTLLFGMLLVPIILIAIVFIVGFNRVVDPIGVGLTASIKDLNLNSQLDSTAQFVRYYDEVLTQSARNYALTGNEYWKERYNQVVPELDKKIGLVISLGDKNDKQIFSDINEANLALVALEEKSMRLADEKKLTEAIAVLDSQEYQKQKKVYQNGLVEYSAKRGVNYNEALSTSTEKIGQVTQEVKSSGDLFRILLIIVLVVVSIFTIGGAAVMGNSVSKPLQMISQQAEMIASGKRGQKIEINSQDEIGNLAKALNKMLDELTSYRVEIEKRVEERTADLEKLNKYMVDRELKMTELKRKIAQLERTNNEN